MEAFEYVPLLVQKKLIYSRLLTSVKAEYSILELCRIFGGFLAGEHVDLLYPATDIFTG